MATALIVTAIIIVAAAFGVTRLGLPRPFRDRDCQGRAWRTAFPDASKDEIREFLLLFVEAFAYQKKDKLKFGPQDEVLAIYRAQYPSQWMADALEVETLDLHLERRYGIKLSAVWRPELSLGELFRLTRSQAPG
jgi:hypothetical protein